MVRALSSIRIQLQRLSNDKLPDEASAPPYAQIIYASDGTIQNSYGIWIEKTENE